MRRILRSSVFRCASTNLKGFAKKFNNWIGMIGIFSCILLLLAIIVIITLYSPIIWNWDALAIYLSVAKGIVATGGLNYNPYLPAIAEISTAYPPVLPILYAWVMSIVGKYFRLIPLMFLFIAGLSVYKIGNLVLGNHGYSFVVLATFLSIPGVQILTGMEGLLADLAFIAYTSAAIYFFISGLLEKDRKKIGLSALAISLSMLTKGLGVPIYFLLLAFMVVALQTRFNVRASFFATTVSMFPFLFQFLYPIAVKVIKQSVTRVDVMELSYLSNTILFFLFSVLFYLVFKNIKGAEFKANVGDILIFLIFSNLGTPFFIRNIINMKMVSTEFLLTSIEIVRDPILRSIFRPPPQINILIKFQFQRLFMSGLVGAPFAIPVTVGIISFLYTAKKRKNVALSFLLACFWELLLIWSFNFNNSFEVWEFRRPTYFTPLLSIFIVDGIITLLKRLRVNDELLPGVFLFHTTLSTIYIWYSKVSSNHLSAGAWVGRASVANIADIFIFASFFLFGVLVSILVNEKTIILHVNALGNTKVWKKSLALILLIVIVLVNICSNLIIISLVLSQITEWNPSYYDTLRSVRYQSQAQALDYEDVEEYFSSNTINKSIILTIGTPFLPYIANNTIIALDNPFSYDYLKPLLEIRDVTQLINRLNQLHINFFLVPKANILNSGYYLMYNSLKKHYLLFQIIGTAYTEFVKDFHSFVLWRLASERLSIFHDKFEREDVGMNWKVINGNWSIKNGVLIQSKLEDTNSIITLTSWADFVLEVDMRTTLSKSKFVYDVAWIKFRYYSSENYYFILLHLDGKVELHSIKNRELRSPYIIVQTNLNPFDWHSFRIEALGPTIRIYIDGKKYIEVVDETPIRYGQIVFSTVNSEAQFDNVRITGIET